MKDRIRLHRPLTLLAGLFAITVGVLQTKLSPADAAPAWPSFVIGGLFFGAITGSYASRHLRRAYVWTVRGLLYALIGWLASISVVGGFATGDGALFLLAFAIFPAAASAASRSVRPALRLGAFGIFVTVVGAILTSAPQGRPGYLIGCLAATAAVEALAARLMVGRRIAKEFTPESEQEPYLPSVTENAPAPLFRTTPSEGLVYANRAFAETFGYSTVADILPKDLETLFADSDEQAELWEKARRNGGFQGLEVELQRKNRSVFTGLLSLRVAYGQNEEVLCCDGTLTDISERKRHEEARLQSMTRLAETAEKKDYGTDGHVRRVGKLSRLLADALGQPREWQRRIEEAAPFHDVGKIGIADDILRKQGPLSESERQAMKEHASIGPALLSGGESERLRTARRIARSHHERWDGTGYPDGLEGDEIPLAARIVAVADAFDAMTHDRPYREALTPTEAFEIIQEEAGAQFDPRVSEAALECRDAMVDVVRNDADSVEAPPREPEVRDVSAATPALNGQRTN